MGMHPGAQISYGLVIPGELVPDDVDDFGEWLEERGVSWSGTEVKSDSSGHLGWGDLTYYIHTRQIRIYAYETQDLNQGDLIEPEGDSAKLTETWERLFGAPPEAAPGWFLTLTYG